MESVLVSLWALLEACRAGSEDERNAAAAAARTSISDANRVIEVTMVGHTLCVDGFPVVAETGEFAAVHGLRIALRDVGVSGLRLTPDVAATALRRWAEDVAAGRLPGAERAPSFESASGARDAGPESPAASARAIGDGFGEPLRRVPSPRAAPERGDSRLRSVFLQHRLIGGLSSIPGTTPSLAKAVVEAVVERLLDVEGGLEPLMLLQQDEEVLRRSTAVAVLVALFARRAGWPTEALADLSTAGLLHDIGAVLDPESPGEAAFHWLLQRGDDDFWLRSALVARRWRDVRAGEPQDGPLLVVGLVRLAVAADRDGQAGVLRALAAGGVSPDLAQVAQDTLAAAG